MMISFEKWLLNGYEGSKPGIKRIITPWLFLHVLIGFGLAIFVASPLKDLARTVLLPILGILIGLTFAWAGNAQGFIQTQELIEISKRKPGGYIDYIFTYQLSIFIVLACAVLWFFASVDYQIIEICN